LVSVVINEPTEELSEDEAAKYELFRLVNTAAIDDELFVIVVVREPTDELNDAEAAR
jgi:hypothetical protein